MNSVTRVLQSKPASYVGLVSGWLVLANAERLSEPWRLPVMVAGAALFAWAWMRVSPCAGGRCEIPKKD